MRFEHYERPETIDTCAKILRTYGDEAKILAGGTDLIPRMRSGKLTTHAVVDITRIPDMQGVLVQANGVRVGAATSLRQIQLCKELQRAYSVLRCGAGHVSSWQIRNVATLGGNVCNASPSADTLPALVLLGAKAVIYGENGLRDTAVSDFCTGPGRTVLQRGEFLVGFWIPSPQERCGAAYLKHAIRGDSDISIVGAGALLALDENGRIQHAKIALASVAPTVLSVPKAEQLLIGKTCDSPLFAEVAQLCAQASQPISDLRASAEYRKKMVRVRLQEALCEAAARANKYVTE